MLQEIYVVLHFRTRAFLRVFMLPTVRHFFVSCCRPWYTYSWHVAVVDDREIIIRVMLSTAIHFFVSCFRCCQPWDTSSCHIADRDTLLRVMMPTVRNFFVSCWFTIRLVFVTYFQVFIDPFSCVLLINNKYTLTGTAQNLTSWFWYWPTCDAGKKYTILFKKEPKYFSILMKILCSPEIVHKKCSVSCG